MIWKKGMCGLVNDALHIPKPKQDSSEQFPVGRSHGKAVILPFTDCKLLNKVKKEQKVWLVQNAPAAALGLSFCVPVVPGGRSGVFVPKAESSGAGSKSGRGVLKNQLHFAEEMLY